MAQCMDKSLDRLAHAAAHQLDSRTIYEMLAEAGQMH